MIKINLTLGNSVFSHYYLPYSEEYASVFEKIKQHNIVLSEKIINYYEECADKINMKDIYRTFIQNLIQTNLRCTMVKGSDSDDIVDELVYVASKQNMKILIAEKDEINKTPKSIKLLRCSDINKSNCLLNLYCIPVTNRYVEPKKNVDKYVKWLGNWLKGEKNIVIRDRYIFDNSGFESFKKYFLPIIEKGANISLHTHEDLDSVTLNKFNDVIFNDYQIYIYKCSKMHDRVIILSDFQIVIGKGVNFLSADNEMTSESFISISNITFNADDTIIKRLR